MFNNRYSSKHLQIKDEQKVASSRLLPISGQNLLEVATWLGLSLQLAWFAELPAHQAMYMYIPLSHISWSSKTSEHKAGHTLSAQYTRVYEIDEDEPSFLASVSRNLQQDGTGRAATTHDLTTK